MHTLYLNTSLHSHFFSNFSKISIQFSKKFKFEIENEMLCDTRCSLFRNYEYRTVHCTIKLLILYYFIS